MSLKIVVIARTGEISFRRVCSDFYEVEHAIKTYLKFSTIFNISVEPVIISEDECIHLSKMSLHAPQTPPTLSPDERARVSKFRETDKDRRVWLIEKSDYRGIISPDDTNHPKLLQRKGWFVRDVPHG